VREKRERRKGEVQTLNQLKGLRCANEMENPLEMQTQPLPLPQSFFWIGDLELKETSMRGRRIQENNGGSEFSNNTL
jgi:hypothetical protein